MTVETLKDCNKKDLAQMAKEQGIVGLARDAQGSTDPRLDASRRPVAEEEVDPRPRSPPPEPAAAAAPSPVARGRRAAAGPPSRPLTGRPARGRSTTPASRTGSSPWSAIPTGCTPTGS